MPAAATAAVDGVPVRRIERPGSEEAVAEALRAASKAGRAVVFRGGGTRLDLGRPPRRVDRLLDLAGLSGVIEHHRRDLTVEAWAGTTVAALNRALRPTGQFVPLDPPLPERATLGGVIAAGETGIRCVPGARPRDLLLGLTAVLADGTRVRAGGRVVKNVTGYELTKLLTGSLGTLAAITRVTLRLRAVPEASATTSFRLPTGDRPERFADRVLAAAAAAPGAEAACVVPPGTRLPGLPQDGGFRFAVRFEGLREEASPALDGVAEAAEAPGERLDPGAAERFWAGVRDAYPAVPQASGALGIAIRGPAGPVLRSAWHLAAYGPPIGFPSQRRALASVPAARLASALAWVEPEVGAAVETAPPGWKAANAVFRPAPPSAVQALNARIKAALDPGGILAPGRTGESPPQEPE